MPKVTKSPLSSVAIPEVYNPSPIRWCEPRGRSAEADTEIFANVLCCLANDDCPFGHPPGAVPGDAQDQSNASDQDHARD